MAQEMEELSGGAMLDQQKDPYRPVSVRNLMKNAFWLDSTRECLISPCIEIRLLFSLFTLLIVLVASFICDWRFVLIQLPVSLPKSPPRFDGVNSRRYFCFH